MLVTRSARTLAIDGGYIHVNATPLSCIEILLMMNGTLPQIMPQANKAKNVFESRKTASYDIKSIVTVQQSGKNSATFKIVVPRDAGRKKRYEFEAESPKLAGEHSIFARLFATSDIFCSGDCPDNQSFEGIVGQTRGHKAGTAKQACHLNILLELWNGMYQVCTNIVYVG